VSTAMAGVAASVAAADWAGAESVCADWYRAPLPAKKVAKLFMMVP
jgi:hypothetical protein